MDFTIYYKGGIYLNIKVRGL